MPASPDETVDSVDSRYFHFFLFAMPHILPYTNIFPTIVKEMFSRSILHRCLRHSVLSISSWVADHRLSRSMDRFQLQYITTLQSIQTSLAKVELDEGIAIAIFLLLYIDSVRADMGAVRKHIKGFRLILRELRRNSNRSPQSPLILDICRIVFRLDWTVSFFLAEEPVFPCISKSQQTEQQLPEQFLEDLDTSEWATMAFALDNLMNQTCRTSVQARQIRRSTGYTSEHEAIIQCQVAKLQEDLLEWRQRPSIRKAEALETQQTASPDTGNVSTFLDYPPLSVFNPFYVNLIGASHAVSVLVSLISDPIMGFATIPERFHLAVEISRTLAALQTDRTLPVSSRIWMVYLAAVAFGGRKQALREVEWLTEKVDDIAKLLPLTRNCFKAGIRLWDFGGDFWDALEIWKPLMGG